MRKAVGVSASVFASFYITVGFTSYASLGNSVEDNVLLSYSEPGVCV